MSLQWPGAVASASVVAFDLDGPTGGALIDGTIWSAPRRFAEGAYDVTSALPRTLRILERHGVTATYFVPGWVVERWPDAVRRIADAGHEVAHHGYRHERFADLTPTQQRDVIARSQEVFERVLGVRAVGYRTPTGDWSAETPAILVDEGFSYSSSLRDDHTPYLHVIDGEPTRLVEIPARVDLDDYAAFAYSRDPDYPSSGDRIAGYRPVLDNYLREADGHHAVGGCFITTFHPKVIATPGRARVVDRLVEHLAAQRDRWVAPAHRVADHARNAEERA
ncbi:polysaccharide deacetylase family protein [Agromyces silvae]|uniref:polysaccharide deacetylase family protein n=1 Tax=Agromyces silvae TaxID=3388266 RepID=UPI00280AFF40|nr:polysaccharide deacetylase [Agromyces protaetiae]